MWKEEQPEIKKFIQNCYEKELNSYHKNKYALLKGGTQAKTNEFKRNLKVSTVTYFIRSNNPFSTVIVVNM